MPPPGWGQGNAFGSGAECNERFRADARRAALAHEARQCARDDVRETEIIKLITASGLERSRRSTASEEVRAAMKCCRLGVDWNLDVSIGKCTKCNGQGRVHAFLCKTRTRKVWNDSEEKRVVVEIKAELDKYLQECRTARRNEVVPCFAYRLHEPFDCLLTVCCISPSLAYSWL